MVNFLNAFNMKINIFDFFSFSVCFMLHLLEDTFCLFLELLLYFLTVVIFH